MCVIAGLYAFSPSAPATDWGSHWRLPQNNAGRIAEELGSVPNSPGGVGESLCQPLRATARPPCRKAHPPLRSLVGQIAEIHAGCAGLRRKKCAGSTAPSCSSGPESCLTCGSTSTWPIRCSSCKRSAQSARPLTGFFPPSAPWRLRPKPSGYATDLFSPFPAFRSH